MSVKNKISVHAYKYNGTLYRSWEFPTVIKKTDEYICVSSRNCKVITYLEDEKRFVYSKLNRPTIWYFFYDKWYNLVLSKRGNGYKYYFNVASPFIFEENVIKYIDFDLDFIINQLDVRTVLEVDQDEYLENQVKYGYPENLKAEIEKVEKELREKCDTNYFDQYLNKGLLFSDKKR